MDSSFGFDTIIVGIIHCTYLGMSGNNLKKKYCILLCQDLFYLHKQCGPW